MTRERPIIFSGDSVRAILEGRKTMTRRVVKPQPPDWIREFGYTCFTPKGSISGRGTFEDQGPAEKFFKSRYGVVRDRLWVREAWHTEVGDLEYARAKHEDLCEPSPIIYRADDVGGVHTRGGCIWRSPWFMPRWASRLTLEVLTVRVERLQEISFKDAVAEGVPRLPGAQEQFHVGWDSLNAKRGFGWATNPWVWALEFRKVTP